MKILVTGSNGFIGRAISLELVRAGHDVVGLRSCEPTCSHDLSSAFKVADIADRAAIETLSLATGPCEAIIHAAAALNKELLAPEVSLVNCLGTQNVLWLARQWQCEQFVYLSGVSVIGKPQYSPITEEHPVCPTSAYLASKLFGEELVRLVAASGLNGVSLRVTAPVGPGMPSNRLLTTLARRAMNNDVIELCGQGTRRQNYVDVRDIARAVVMCLTRKVSGIFNIAGDDTISNLELARRCVVQCRSTSEIVFDGQVDPEEGYDWNVSSEKARRVLGYKPNYTIEDAIAVAFANRTAI